MDHATIPEERNSSNSSHSTVDTMSVLIRRSLPHKDKICVNIDSSVHLREHVWYKQSLSRTNSEHGPHVLPVLKHIHTCLLR